MTLGGFSRNFAAASRKRKMAEDERKKKEILNIRPIRCNTRYLVEESYVRAQQALQKFINFSQPADHDVSTRPTNYGVSSSAIQSVSVSGAGGPKRQPCQFSLPRSPRASPMQAETATQPDPASGNFRHVRSICIVQKVPTTRDKFPFHHLPADLPIPDLDACSTSTPLETMSQLAPPLLTR